MLKYINNIFPSIRKENFISTLINYSSIFIYYNRQIYYIYHIVKILVLKYCILICLKYHLIRYKLPEQQRGSEKLRWSVLR